VNNFFPNAGKISEIERRGALAEDGYSAEQKGQAQEEKAFRKCLHGYLASTVHDIYSGDCGMNVVTEKRSRWLCVHHGQVHKCGGH
jgi:hypothetical protein